MRDVFLQTMAVASSAAALASLFFPELSGAGEDRARGFAAPGRSISGLAFDGEKLWITLDGEATILRVDPADGAVERSFAYTSTNTAGSAWDGEHLWQIAYQERRIDELDVATGRVLRSIRSPGEGMCSGITFDGEHLWVGNFDDEKIYEIDQEAGGEILHALPSNHEVAGLAWDGRALWEGLLIGPKKHEDIAVTGFAQKRDPRSGERSAVLALQGVGPLTSDWLPGRERAAKLWWYDGVTHRIVRLELASRALPSVAPSLIAISLVFMSAALIAFVLRR